MTLHTKQSRGLKQGRSVAASAASALTEKGQRRRRRERTADGGIRSQIEREREGLLSRPPKLNQEEKGGEE